MSDFVRVVLSIFAALGVAVLIAGASVVPASAPPAAGPGLKGRVTFTGADPDGPLPLDAQPACVALHDGPVISERIARDSEGRLANVLVILEGQGTAGLPDRPSEEPVLIQKGCLYQPRVVAMRMGQELTIRNDDPLLHNVHWQPELNARFNIGQPFQGAESKRTFSEPELGIRIKCDIHPWMIAIIHVLDHGYFQVTDAGGGFEWPQLVPGDYTLRLWHEELGTREQSVTIGEGSQTEIEIAF